MLRVSYAYLTVSPLLHVVLLISPSFHFRHVEYLAELLPHHTVKPYLGYILLKRKKYLSLKDIEETGCLCAEQIN